MAVDTGKEDAATTSARPEQQFWSRWRSAFFAPVGDGQRRRPGADGLRGGGAGLGPLCCLLVIHFDSRVDRAIVQVVHPPPRSITWLVTVVYEAGSFGVITVLVIAALLARRWVVARDIGLTAALAAAVSGLLVVGLGSSGGRSSGVMIGSYALSFPVLQIALFAAVAVATLPYLGRSLQRGIEVFIALVALACVVGGHGLPLNVVGSLVIGWGAAAVIRLVFGSPLGLPSVADVRMLLAGLGIGADDLHPVAQQVWGVVKYQATETGASGAGRLDVSIYGRDAADARLLTKAGRFVLYRDSGPSLAVTRLQQVEHEAFLTFRAAQAGVTVPEVVEAGAAGPSGDALLVVRPPAGLSLAGTGAAAITDTVLADLYRQLLSLRRARIAHGAVSGETVLVDAASQTVVLTDFRNGIASASVAQLDRDLAGALAATAVAVRAERGAAAAARRCPAAPAARDRGGGRSGAGRGQGGPGPAAGGARERPPVSAQAGPGPGRGPEPEGPAQAAGTAPPAGRPGRLDRSAGAGPAPPGERGHADYGGRLADRRLGPDRRAHRRVPFVRHPDRGRVALGDHGARPRPAGLRGLGCRGSRQRGRAAPARAGGGRRGRQRVQQPGRW